MAKRTETKKREQAVADAAEIDVAGAAGNVDKIRDILFGREIRDYERRFTHLEELMQRSVDDLRSDLDARLQTLETHVKNELGTLTERIRSERRDRSDAVTSIERELESTGRTLRERLTETADRLADAEQALRAQLLELSQTTREEMRRQGADLGDRLESSAAGLTDRKVDRTALASLLSEVALRLSGELDVSDLASLADD